MGRPRKRRVDDLSGWGGEEEGDISASGHNVDPHSSWRLTREKLLMFAGLIIIGASFINSEIFRGTFHREYLIAGLALCGISITTWLDRRVK